MTATPASDSAFAVAGQWQGFNVGSRWKEGFTLRTVGREHVRESSCHHAQVRPDTITPCLLHVHSMLVL